MSAVAALRELYAATMARIDGETLVRAALPGGLRPTHVAAFGKAALPMVRGALAHDDRRVVGLAVSPRHLLSGATAPASGARLLGAEHPDPGEGSLAAATAARELVAAVPPDGRLLVLLSGGTSSLLCAPAGALSLDEKRTALRQLARAGVAIRELNVVRKHLSSVKGGQLGALARAPTTVLLLSDVLGDDPATVGSGPFSPDPSTYAEALEILRGTVPDAPPAVLAHLQAGVRGDAQETPKPGDPRLDGVEVKVIAGPALVRETALGLARGAGWQVQAADTDTATAVSELAEHVLRRARGAAPGQLVVGNGEPTLRVTGAGRGGRATHLALLVARGLHLPAGRRSSVAFLAAGTDDRDGSGDATGAVVDGTTWQAVLDAGLDPQRALDDCDSYTVLERVGATVRGPGTSNLLDIHLMAVI